MNKSGEADSIFVDASGDSLTFTTDELGAFADSSEMTMRVLRDALRVRSLEILPGSTSGLRLSDDDGRMLPLHVPCDAVTGLTALITRSFEADLVAFADGVIRRHAEPVCLIDIGANVGLFTRQLLSTLRDQITCVHAYEPHPSNFELLSRNLAGIALVNLHPAGLGDRQATSNLYTDPENCGNFSFLRDAMPARHDSISADMWSAGAQEGDWLSSGVPIFYKSDTQGLDELIATSLSDGFWDAVVGGVMEVWCLPGKILDEDRFAAFLDHFDNKVMRSHPRQKLSTEGIVRSLAANPGLFNDLLFWKN